MLWTISIYYFTEGVWYINDSRMEVGHASLQ